jgi:acetyl-CoA carboxylase carboxyltransferase component
MEIVALQYERGTAINTASVSEIDAVIDPADTRKWIMRGLKSAIPRQLRKSAHAYVDPW